MGRPCGAAGAAFTSSAIGGLEAAEVSVAGKGGADEEDGGDEALPRLREEYAAVRDELRRATKDGTASEELRERCRAAKAALREVLAPGQSALGGAARSEPADRPVAGKRIAIPHAQLAGVASPLPAALRRQRVFSFDTSHYPFRELVAEVLGVEPEALPQLHRLPGAPSRPAQDPAQSSRSSCQFQRRWHAARGGDARQRFSSLLHRFVAEFVAPRMHARGEEEDEEARVDEDSEALVNSPLGRPAIAYQREPTMRVQVPSDEAMGYVHSDADYHHPPSEVNWWLPLTRVWGSNTLHTESEPGRGDFAPVELEYGRALRFYGNLCQHFTLPNSTDHCRVSFDFRVLHLPSHDPHWVDQRGRPCTFQVGSYYSPLEGGGAALDAVGDVD